ncbi:hypothetical protein H6F67_24520 [Microcoleus sp. FACHB-1515]|uniref:hypothetical protein n=1 Tax=Cyanophyceae TaxID=3028117 RepID=UPI0016861FC5|nr:hypothetical protein [Microcoleus sp. FACHB-1515]MBD2093016.1 hypothetical protein [Microcoleus sp. FACHB-1515]
MDSNLEDLKISDRELERISGFDVSNLFVGGIFGGFYRPSIFCSKSRSLQFFITEVLVFALLFIFTLPIGLAATRNSVNSFDQLSVVILFFQVTLGSAIVLLAAWNLYMWRRVQQMKPLLRLLDEVDQFNQILGAIDVIDRLHAAQSSQQQFDRQQVLSALNLTRDTLIAGLTTEKILRDSRGLLSRSHDLVANIERNLAAIESLSVSDRANDYQQLLQEALEIGVSVQREVQQYRSR